jgi:hypothetical protein
VFATAVPVVDTLTAGPLGVALKEKEFSVGAGFGST